MIKAACREYIDSQREINWEQRRYEIAMSCYASNRDASAEQCVAWADKLIEALKAKKGGVE